MLLSRILVTASHLQAHASRKVHGGAEMMFGLFSTYLLYLLYIYIYFLVGVGRE